MSAHYISQKLNHEALALNGSNCVFFVFFCLRFWTCGGRIRIGPIILKHLDLSLGDERYQPKIPNWEGFSLFKYVCVSNILDQKPEEMSRIIKLS